MLQRPASQVGLYYLVVLAGVPIGSFSSSRLARRVPSVLLLRATSAIALAGAALFFVVAANGDLTVVTVLGPMILFSFGVGAASPVAITAAISTDPQLIGAASGLYGFMQMANGAVCTLMVGLIRPIRHSPPPLSCSPASFSPNPFSCWPRASLQRADPRFTALSCLATFAAAGWWKLRHRIRRRGPAQQPPNWHRTVQHEAIMGGRQNRPLPDNAKYGRILGWRSTT
jgi:hypothetical protein